MAQGYIHTVYRGGHWYNDVESVRRGSQAYPTKDRAVAAGRLEAIKGRTEHVIHNEDDTIAYRNSYGHDPRSSVG